MTRESVIQLLTNQVTPQTMFNICKEYVFDRTGKTVEHGDISIDPFQFEILRNLYQFAIEWYTREYTINMVYNQNKDLIKIY